MFSVNDLYINKSKKKTILHLLKKVKCIHFSNLNIFLKMIFYKKISPTLKHFKKHIIKQNKNN